MLCRLLMPIISNNIILSAFKDKPYLSSLKMIKYILSSSVLFAVLLLCGCNERNGTKTSGSVEDLETKTRLAGIWIDEEEATVVFRIKGDTVFYPDSTIQPIKFVVKKDTMYFLGNSVSKYPIRKLKEHLLELQTLGGDIITLVKSENPYDSLLFVHSRHVMLNQKKTIKRDTIVSYGDLKYHCYIQINPTTYKVFRRSYNDESIEVENIYYDNTIHVSVFSGTRKMFSKDFSKSDFVNIVPENMLQQSVLSDITLIKMSPSGLSYAATLAIPDSQVGFIADFDISNDWKITKRRHL